jgi:hypothetical protein
MKLQIIMSNLNALYTGSVAQSTSVFESHRPDGVSVETYTPG